MDVVTSTGSTFLDTLKSFIYPADDDLEEDNTQPITLKSNKLIVEGTRHSFQPKTIAIPTFCNSCKEIIWGFSDQGHYCTVCGYCVHSRCMNTCSASCRPKVNLKSKTTNTEHENDNESPSSFDDHSDDPELNLSFFLHHLVEANLPIGSECSVCKDSFELQLGFNGLRCSRCEKTVHNRCVQTIKMQQCQPRHRRLLFLKNIKDTEYHTPLIVFVNSRSGGQVGGQLMYEFGRLLDKRQVFDLNVDKGPERGLNKFRNVPNLRVLVCGGDGTVGWVLTALDKVDLPVQPPVGILPLGTGNDLARTLGWGTGYAGENLSDILDSIEYASTVPLDRWTVKFSNGKQGFMNNYMSVGVDAEVALSFHRLRTEKPELFSSQFINKFWYAHYGMLSMFSDITEIAEMIDLEVDGSVISIPEGVGGIMILNLPNYAGGADLWSSSDYDDYKPQSVGDQLIEIVAITGSFHMGTIQVNLSKAIRIAQGSSIKITLHQALPVQVDGEPWTQEPSAIEVTFFKQTKMLYKTEDIDNATKKLLSETSEEAVLNVFQRQNHILKQENTNLKLQIERLKEELEQERRQRIQLEKTLHAERKAN